MGKNNPVCTISGDGSSLEFKRLQMEKGVNDGTPIIGIAAHVNGECVSILMLERNAAKVVKSKLEKFIRDTEYMIDQSNVSKG